MAPTPVPETQDSDVEALEAVCERMVGFDPMANLEWLDGYMAALAAGPRRVPVEEWLPVFADGLFARVFADEADAAPARRLIAKRYAELCWQLDAEAILDAPDELRIDPLMYKFDADTPEDATPAEGDAPAEGAAPAQDEAVAVPAEPVPSQEAAPAEDEALTPADWPGDGVYWALGFGDAIADFADDWEEPDEDAEDAQLFHDLLESIALLAETEGEARQETMHRLYDGVDLDRDELIHEALFATQELRMYWLNHAAKPAQRRIEPKVGRNDPCPCGSGKKYKKCHGAEA